MEIRRIILAVVVLTLLAAGGVALWFFSQQSGEIVLQRINARSDASVPGVVYVFAAFTNASGPDQLESVQSKDAARAELFNPAGMVPLPIPAGATPSLAADGAHIRLFGVEGDLDVGRLIPVTLKFANAGKVKAKVKVGTALSHVTMGESGEYGIGRTLPIPQDAAIPRLALRKEKVAEGWRIHLDIENFEFTQSMELSEENPFSLGHAHLYLSGLKLARVFDDSIEIGQLAPGSYEVRIILVSADHRALMVDNEIVKGITTIEVN